MSLIHLFPNCDFKKFEGFDLDKKTKVIGVCFYNKEPKFFSPHSNNCSVNDYLQTTVIA